MLASSRLILRTATAEDAPFIYQLYNEPSFKEHIADKNIHSLEAAKQYLCDGPFAKEAGLGLFVVETKADSKAIGVCGLIQRDELPRPDLGYALLPDAWGCGYAFEAAKCVIDSANDSEILAICRPSNTKSAAVLTRLGFKVLRPITVANVTNDLYSLGTD